MPFALATIPFDQSTPNLLDPSDNGAAMYSIPANTYVDIALLGNIPPDQPGNFALCLNDANTGSAANGPYFSRDAGTNDAAKAFSQYQYFYTTGQVRADSAIITLKAIQPMTLYMAWYSDSTPPSTLSGELVLKLYS